MSKSGRTSRKGDGSVAFQKPKDFGKTIFRIFSYLKKSKFLVVVIVITLIANSVSGIAGSYFLKPLINDYILPGDLKGLFGALVVLGLIYLVGVIAGYIQSRTTVSLAQRTINHIRQEMFDKLQELPVKYYDTYTHGELMSRFTNDAENVQLMLEQSLTQMISSTIILVGAVTFMIILSPIIFVATLLMIICMFFVVKILGGKSKKNYRAQQAKIGILNGNIEETIGGLKEIKAFNNEQDARTKFQALNNDFEKVASKASFYAGAMMPIMFNLNNISYAISASVGGLLAVYGMFSVGSLASYLQFSRQIGQPINQFSAQMNNIYAAVAGAERIFALMDEEKEVDEGLVVLEEATENSDEQSWNWVLEDGTKVPLKGDVRLNNVSFSYNPENPILKNISLYAKPGQMIAFVGSTGAGKTTITNLINRFFETTEGIVTYDGIDIKRIQKNSLRRSLGMVLQDTHLFTGSILDNIRYGNPDATDEDCKEAAKNTNAHSFIRRLPEGYDTIIGGDGNNLSQGQRQLIAIARAYVAKPPVMILDEATSSIDTRTEQLVQKGMDELMKGRTVFVIAHRLSTVRNSKAIIVLENGEIIERGDHDELLEMKGRYHQLYTGLAELA